MLTEILARSGFEAQIFDCEHGAYDYGTLMADVGACERGGGVPFVRVSGRDKIEVQRCLDLGARGLLFPQLASADEVRAAALMMDYAPTGTRGFNPFVRAAGYGAPKDADRLRPPAWFVPIIETVTAVAEIDQIVIHPRVDLVYIGVYDLSAQLGVPGDMGSPALARLIDLVIDACRAAGKPVGMMALSAESAAALIARGVQVLVHGVEAHRLLQAGQAILEPLRSLSLGNEFVKPR